MTWLSHLEEKMLGHLAHPGRKGKCETQQAETDSCHKSSGTKHRKIEKRRSLDGEPPGRKNQMETYPGRQQTQDTAFPQMEMTRAHVHRGSQTCWS